LIILFAYKSLVIGRGLSDIMVIRARKAIGKKSEPGLHDERIRLAALKIREHGFVAILCPGMSTDKREALAVQHDPPSARGGAATASARS